MTDQSWIPTADGLVEARAARALCRWYQYYPADGPLRRGLYPKHMAYFAAGAHWRQRLFLAANRIGKTDVAAFELTCHLTGVYPDWWTGRRFDTPIEAWAAGDTSGTARDIIQVALLGPTRTIDSRAWCGMIPRVLVKEIARKQGIADAVSTIWVHHRSSGGVSTVDIKSYDQKREAFQGTTKHVIWEDEEPPADIHGEALIRTMTVNGLMLVTMTPLMGLTPFLSEWLERSSLEVFEDGKSVLRPAHVHVFGSSERAPGDVVAPTVEPSRYTVMANWDDCPHLDEQAKLEMLKEVPIYQREARSKGIPALGSGTIYPVLESEVRCAPFDIPEHWPRAYALDTGWDWTAAVWGALDRESQTCYIYSAYKRGHAEPPIHAEAIKARGAWIPGVGDAAQITQSGGQQFIAIYRALGLDLALADKSVEAGIQDVWTLLSAGRLKVFGSCGAWFDEYRLYRRDEKGRIVKQNDHLMDCTRMWVRSGRTRAKVRMTSTADVPRVYDPKMAETGWMAG